MKVKKRRYAPRKKTGMSVEQIIHHFPKEILTVRVCAASWGIPMKDVLRMNSTEFNEKRKIS